MQKGFCLISELRKALGADHESRADCSEAPWDQDGAGEDLTLCGTGHDTEGTGVSPRGH
jgi:hypothetical protein